MKKNIAKSGPLWRLVRFFSHPPAVRMVKLRDLQRELEFMIFRRSRLGKLRIGAWPVGSTHMDPDPVNRLEHFFLNESDNSISKPLFIYENSDFEKLARAVEILGKDFSKTTLIDAGANIGTISIPAVGRGIFLNAIAIEPSRVSFELLEQNVKLNAVSDRFICLQKALGRSPEEKLHFMMNENYSGHSYTDFEQKNLATIEVESTSLDFVVGSDSSKIGLIFMDIEGFEGVALQGARRTLENGQIPIVMEFSPATLEKNSSLTEIQSSLSQYEYFADLNTRRETIRPMSTFSRYWKDFYSSKSGSDIVVFNQREPK